MIEFPEIQNLFDLYEKFKREQWSATELSYGKKGLRGDITGDYGPTWIDLAKVPSIRSLDQESRDLFVWEHAWLALCTSIQGEDFAVRLCASEAEEVPENDARMALSMQIVDEVRHYETGMRILANRYRDMNFVYLEARERRWKDLLSENYTHKLIGFHVVTEGLAMGRFRNRELNSPDPVVREMYRRINIDEARHTALGMLYLSRKIKDIPQSERSKLEDYVFQKVLEDYQIYTEKMFSKDICRKVGLDAEDLIEEVKKQRLDDIVRVELNRRVMPKLNQLGLLPERLVPKYKQHGLFVDRNPPPTAMIRIGSN